MDSLKAKIAKQDSALEGEKKKFNALDKGLNQARTSEYLDWKAYSRSCNGIISNHWHNL